MKISWKKYNLNEMPVYLTKHADDRSKFRDNRPVNISKSRIENIINKAENYIMNLKDKFNHFVIKTQNSLNIVGELVKEKNEWVFDVITIMIKDKFFPKHSTDKVIYVNEVKNMKKITLKSLIKEDINIDDLYKQTVDYLESKLNNEHYKKYIYANGNDTTFTKRDNVFDNRFSVIKYPPVDGLLLKFVAKVIIKSVSLADPRAAYQTTSARSVQHKKISIDKDVNDINKAKKEIDKFIERISKINSYNDKHDSKF
jgi:hypothetical protein